MTGTLRFKILQANGGPKTVPTALSLYVVPPGGTDSEIVVGAEFVNVAAAVYEVSYPSDVIDTEGLYTFFVVDGSGRSSDVEVVQNGAAPGSTRLWAPFTARNSVNAPVENLDYADVTLTVATGRAVLSSEFAQLTAIPATPTPFYMVYLKEDEVESGAPCSYVVTGPESLNYARTLQVSEGPTSAITFQLDPAYEGVSLGLRDDDGEVVHTGVTGPTGEVSFVLEYGTYTAVLSNQNWVFSSNNVDVIIDEDSGNFFSLSADYSVPAVSPSGFCRISFRLLGADGSPISGRKVIFYPSYMSSGSSGIVKGALAAVTDSDGNGYINLISGLSVVVTVEGTRVHETFTVPSTPEANLFELISFQDKGFEFYAAEFDHAIRRVL